MSTPSTARTVAALRDQVREWRKAGLTVGFVPTMGALHEGHLSLVRLALAEADRVLVSIFVNPTQFAPTEDFGSYPRTWKADVAKLAAERVDLIWHPDVQTMYPEGFATRIVPEGLAAAGLEDRHDVLDEVELLVARRRDEVLALDLAILAYLSPIGTDHRQRRLLPERRVRQHDGPALTRVGDERVSDLDE